MIKKIPLTFLIAIVLFMLAQALVVRLSLSPAGQHWSKNTFDPPDRVPSIEETIMSWNLRNLELDTTSADIVLLGDSSCLVGLDTLALEKMTGKSVRNMGTIGWLTPQGHAEFLEEYLKTHRAPQLLVYHMSLEVMELTQQSINSTDFLNRFRAAIGKAKPDDVFDVIPMYKFRYNLREMLYGRKSRDDSFRKVKRGAWLSAEDLTQELQDNRGHIVDPSEDSFASQPPNPRHFDIKPDLFGGIFRLGQIAKQNHFKVYFVLNPLPESMFGMDKKWGDLSQTESQVRALLGQPDNFVIRDKLLIPMKDKNFKKQFTHLNSDGARDNTILLGNELKQKFKF